MHDPNKFIIGSITINHLSSIGGGGNNSDSILIHLMSTYLLSNLILNLIIGLKAKHCKEVYWLVPFGFIIAKNCYPSVLDA